MTVDLIRSGQVQAHPEHAPWPTRSNRWPRAFARRPSTMDVPLLTTLSPRPQPSPPFEPCASGICATGACRRIFGEADLSGGWRVEGGEWRVEVGGWRVESRR